MMESQSDMTPGLLSGRLEGMSIPDLMWGLCRRGATGVLRVAADGIRRTVYLEGGQIVFAASSDPDDRLGELLLREGYIRLDELENALRHLGSGKRLGTILVEAGHLSPDDLVRGVLTQVRHIVVDLFTWESGEYGFEPGPLPTREVITLDVGTADLLLQGIRRIRSFTRIRRSVGPPRTIYRLRPGARETVVGLSLTSGEEHLLDRLEGEGVPIDLLCNEVFLSNFEVYQALWALRVLGVVDVDERSGTVVGDTMVAGRFGAETIVPVLVRLCRAGETGVLCVSRDNVERTVHIRDGHVVFATSTDIDDGLIAYLLRRGVISLRDREETAKRLLSNKRVGTILREMGVIDDVDLRNLVREQLTDVLHDTIAWPDGDYAFVPGELPTIEEITLDGSLEALVTGGLRRVRSWSRIRDGIGGVRQPLALTPDFLTVLDRMGIGPEEWEVVTALRTPRSALDICGETGLGDFRVSQILWTLRMLGAATFVDEAEIAADGDGEETAGESGGAEAVAAPPAVAAATVDPVPSADLPEVEEMPGDDGQAVVEDEPVVTAPDATDEAGWNVPSPDEAGAADEPEPQATAPGDVVEGWGEAPADEHEDVAAREDDPGADDAPAGTGGWMHGHHASFVASGGAWSGGGNGGRSDVIAAGDDLEVDDAPEDVEDPAGFRSDDDAEAFELHAGEASPVEAFDDDAGLEVDAAPFESPDATQALDPEVVRAALEGAPVGFDRAEGIDATFEDEDEDEDADEDEVEAEHESAAEFEGDEDSDSAMEVDSAMEFEAGTDGGVADPEPDDGWTPPADLDEQIARFNARQRVLYRTLRAEIGAGAVNFVRSCSAKVGDEASRAFAEAELNPDGTWNPDELRRATVERRVEDPRAEYDRLLEVEFEMLQMQIGEARAQALREQMERATAQPAAG